MTKQNKEEWTPCIKKPLIVHFREVKGTEEIFTLENREGDSLIANANEDYIMRGVDGELYPIKRELFHRTYDIVKDTNDT